MEASRDNMGVGEEKLKMEAGCNKLKEWEMHGVKEKGCVYNSESQNDTESQSVWGWKGPLESIKSKPPTKAGSPRGSQDHIGMCCISPEKEPP